MLRKCQRQRRRGSRFCCLCSFGIAFADVTFISDSAQVGETASTVGSGTLYGSCRFTGNQARATGGAIQSAAGHENIVRSMYERNRGGAGGAMTLAGTASVESWIFVENVSDDGKGANVSSIGSISAVSKISLFLCGNELECQPCL